MLRRGRQLKNHNLEAELFRRRALVGFLGVLLALGGLAAWYFRLQVVHHDDYARQSEANRIKPRPVVPARGLIYDRKGRLLADNVPAFRLDVTPDKVKDMDATLAGAVDAICFAPLNKQAMKLGGLTHEDELHHFAEHLGVTDYFCEFNTLGSLWTSRVSSHIPLKDAASYLSVERIQSATRLIHQSLRAAGVARPRVAVAAFNPHGGDGGVCGREEIDIIAPAVAGLNAEGLDIAGPFPADTIFLKARDGLFDAIVTMYHDQGQIAIKLMGFSKGVTVQGGLPIPITTPAHGTAYDIAGQGRADVNATYNAFRIAARMGASVRSAA